MTNLDSADIKHSVDGFLTQNNNQPGVALFSSSLRSMDKDRQTDFVHKILGTITDQTFLKTITDALVTHIKDHPFQTAFFVVGIVLLCIPNLALGPFGGVSTMMYTGSFVSLWSMSNGGVDSANRSLAIIHTAGMLLDIVLPAAVKVAEAVGNEIGKWGSGQYGTPVQNWARGDYGNPVEQWWNGNYGNPVSSWFGSVINR